MMMLSRTPGRKHGYILQCLRVYGRRPSSTAAPTNSLSDVKIQDSFTRSSKFWIPTGGIAATENEDAHNKLIRAGYLRQSHAGIFHMLPLGQKVQEKLERLIDKYMLQLGASKVSLSSISSQALWQQTNRLDGYGPELFRFDDRKEVPYLLAPTHEEEITTLVSKTIKSYKSLPLRLYQIGRKYRDEIRPRQGVLRSREFLMKDLYTFDYSIPSAISTYEEIREAYSRLFNELKLPYLVAEASSGDIGGDLSHEYHLPSPIGEDNVISCNSCDYVANEELASARLESMKEASPETNSGDVLAANVWRGVSKDRSTLINVWYPASFSGDSINTHAIKSALPELDSSLNDSTPFWSSTIPIGKSSEPRKQVRLVNIIDYRLGAPFASALSTNPSPETLLPKNADLDLSTITTDYLTASDDQIPLNVLRVRDGDNCPRCDSGKLKVQKAIELGHTFHLGTRYSDPLEAHVQVPSHLIEGEVALKSAGDMKTVSMQMGCHGIGLSRIIGAVADHLADAKGLNWPRAIAPFEVVVVPGRGLEQDGVIVAEYLANSQAHRPLDLLLDDRTESLPWKMRDADLVGYPVVVILGKGWNSERLCEVQCRRLSSVSHVLLEDLPIYINQLLAQL
ncbi:prolyl-tRNA synthetase [Hypoxylon trugodes]|uniref:prolyl-tRNA synthetase n=1 Tax=Hypoxylon trugodes TaxID=326681 RepID=UPI002190CA2A|nr:prolyl-tRNA synthetase [Hypoxylon trugodes]KAI1386924.1 prolyl-tRNA synthetase [Hypoxylon trugodes]